jgi:hypothetical protein
VEASTASSSDLSRSSFMVPEARSTRLRPSKYLAKHI